MDKVKENRPIIIFVHKECESELSFSPKHGRVVDLMEMEPDKTTCGQLIQGIIRNQSNFPGDNIYLVPWDPTSCALLSMRNYDVVAVIPKYVDYMSKSSYWEELIFRMDKDMKLKDIKQWMIQLQIPRFPVLKKLFPSLKKFY